MKEAKEEIRRVSLAELRAKKDRGETRGPRKDAPTYEVPEEFWKNARPFAPPKKPVQLRIDEDVLDFFKAEGRGHLTRMNAVLRHYMEAKRRAEAPRKGSRPKP